jgi:hypothetical protein
MVEANQRSQFKVHQKNDYIFKGRETFDGLPIFSVCRGNIQIFYTRY